MEVFKVFLPAQNSPAPEFEQILDIPVPRGCGSSGGGGLQGLHPGQSSTAFPEQLVENPVSGGRPEQSSSSSLDGSNEDYTRFFALFPVQKKVRSPAGRSLPESSRTPAHGRRRLMRLLMLAPEKLPQG